MAKDLIGELGLDTSDFEKALDRVGDKASSKFGNAMKEVGKNIAAVFGAKAIAQYIYNLRKLDAELDEMRAKMIEGGKDTADGGPAVAFRRAGVAIDRFTVKAKLATAQSIQGLRLFSENFGNKVSEFFGVKGQTHEVASQIKADTAVDAKKKEIMNDEDTLARIQSDSLATQERRLYLISQELALQQKRIALIKSEPTAFEDPRGAMNQALQAVGALKAEREAIEFSREQELKTARAVTMEMQLQQKGLSGAVKETELRAKYEKEITQALRDGKTELASQLKLQMQLSLNQLRVNEHNMTNAQRRNERTGARKFNRDLRKTEAHERDLEERLNRAMQQGDRITPGSELDRYRARRSAMRAAQGKNAVDNGKGIDAQLANTFNKDGLTALKSIDGKMIDLFKMP